MRLLLLLIPLCLATPCVTNTESAVRCAISAILKAVQLFKKEHKGFNLDGVLGYNVLLGQIKGTLERFDPKKDLYAYKAMKQVKKVLIEVINNTTYFLKQSDLEYFEDFHDLLKGQFWTPTTSWNQTNPGLAYRGPLANESLCLTGESSNECIISLLGSIKKNKEPCVVTAPCRKIMNQKGCIRYALNHQLLYFIIGKMKHCSNDMFGKDFGNYTNAYCADMMKTNVEIEQSGYPESHQDLFMENIMLCGLCGYSDFYKLEWMNKIISWQLPNIGCFGDTEDDVNSKKAVNENHSRKRVKREEKIFSGAGRCFGDRSRTLEGSVGKRKREVKPMSLTCASGEHLVSSIRDLCAPARCRIERQRVLFYRSEPSGPLWSKPLGICLVEQTVSLGLISITLQTNTYAVCIRAKCKVSSNQIYARATKQEWQ
ncbi:UPF0764 protein C16orf89 homolog isoform X2 [Eleutherodactylus coqui]|uniref:UPF0764 protein C16orf89 homolog isoform X2 n=1 Tax=Eleutherodactylus coqui TaxID=57060 RepID=UPI003461FC21